VPRGDDSTPVRVAFFGNVANSLFDIVRALRDVDGLDAHLYVSTTDSPRPEDADPSLLQRYPDWLHAGDWITPVSLLAPWRAPVTRALSGYDLVVVSGPGPVFAQWTARPWCWFVSGADLTVKPFPITFWSRYPNLRHRLGEVVAGFWQRRAARRPTEMWLQPFAPMTGAATRLKVPPAAISPRYFPLMVDVDEFDPERPLERPDDPTVRRMVDADFSVFHPSRIVIRNTEAMRRTGQLKANDVLIRGFAEFVRRGEVARPLLVIPDVEMSPDLDLAKALVEELDIAPFVEWGPPPPPEGFPRHDLLDFYSVADVVADDFGVGWFGYVALEGLAMAKPVVTHVDGVVMDVLYDDPHPFCTAQTPGEVADRLSELAGDPDERAVIGRRGRDWVVSHHAPPAVRARYVDAFRELLENLAPGAQRAVS